jgi:CheY-like chemotaxis protein
MPGQAAMVLIIEDDASLRALLLDLLDGEDSRVRVSTHHGEAVQLASSHQPRAILLDVGRPGPSGWAVLQQLRASDRTRHIPVIALSDRSEPPVEVVHHWPNALLAKPFDVFVLLEHLARAVEQTTSDGEPTLEGADAR